MNPIDCSHDPLLLSLSVCVYQSIGALLFRKVRPQRPGTGVDLESISDADRQIVRFRCSGIYDHGEPAGNEGSHEAEDM